MTNINTENETNDQSNSISHKKHFWKKEEEELLREWADKAQCYQWLHLQSHDKYRKKNTWFTIPVIILSTITGTANFAQDRFGEDYKNAVVMGIGSLNIIAGIITTIYQFLKISEYNEAHRVASLSWGKFYRNIKTELTKHPLDRYAPYEMVKMSKEEFDRLVEISPLIPNDIAVKFKKVFKKIEGVTRPDIVGKLEPTTIYEISEEERKRLEKIYLYGETQSTNSNYVPNVNGNYNNTLTNPLPPPPINQEVSNRVIKFRNTFFKLNNRYPNNEEIQRKLNMVYDDETEMDDIARILGNTISYYPLESSEKMTNSYFSNQILNNNNNNNNINNINNVNNNSDDGNYLEMTGNSDSENDDNNDGNNNGNNGNNGNNDNNNIVVVSNNTNDDDNNNTSDNGDSNLSIAVSEV